jgi:hypothetical protein
VSIFYFLFFDFFIISRYYLISLINQRICNGRWDREEEYMLGRVIYQWKIMGEEKWNVLNVMNNNRNNCWYNQFNWKNNTIIIVGRKYHFNLVSYED